MIDGPDNRFRRLGDRLRGGGAARSRRRSSRGWHVVGRDRRAGRRRADPQPDPDRRAGRRRGRPRRPGTRRAGRGGGRRRRPRLPCDGRPDRAVRRAGARSRADSATSPSSPASWRIRRRSPSPAATGPPDPPAVDDDYVDCTVDGTMVRYTPAQAHSVLRLAPPGNVVARPAPVRSRRPSRASRSTTPSSPTSRRSTTGRGCGAASPIRAAPSSRCSRPTSSPTRRRRCTT